MDTKGLGLEIVKAVLEGEIIEPITYERVKKYCIKNGLLVSEKHMRVILSNASKNTHSPTYKKYFERVGRGAYIVLPEHKPRNHRFYWLNVDSSYYKWSFSDIKIGRSQIYSNLNNEGNRKKSESSFKNIRIGDQVVAYETGVYKAVTTICQVVNKYEENNEIFVEFQKIKDFDKYVELSLMKESKELKNCNVVHFHRGTLFELEEVHYKYIANKIEELNNIFEPQNELYNYVQKSIADNSEKRKMRLANRTVLHPDSYISTTRVFIRNPDVIAEVLLRANGVCERCNKIAPFNRASDGTPYLEVHHIVRLSDGGEDTVENANAVCPNCHRELHFG